MVKVFLIGNLTKSPELTETQSGISVCRFSVATNRGTGDDRKTDFYNVTAWRGLGETIARYQKKGDKIAVVGNLEQRKYEDREGIERTVYDVIATDVEFLGSRRDGNEINSDDNSSNARPARSGGKRKPALQDFDGFDGSDIPF